MSAGAAIGAAAAQGVINAGVNIGTAAFNNWLAEKREAKARKENYMYGEMAADNADARTRSLYNSFYTPGAQLRLIKEAGLSPSLLTSEGAGAGGTGQAGAQGTGASGVSPTIFGVDPLSISQMELMKAQARKLNTEADEMEGKTPLSIAKIAELLASAKAKNAAASLNKAEETNLEIKNYVDNKTKDFNVRYLQYLAEKEYNETKKAGYEAEREGIAFKFDTETYNDRVAQLGANVDNLIAETNERLSNIKLNNEQIELIKAKVKKVFKEIELRATEVQTQHNQWKTYDELVANEINKMWRDTDIAKEANNIKELGIYLDLISTLIGSVAHIAGMNK